MSSARQWRQPPQADAGRILSLYNSSDDFRRCVGLIGTRMGAIEWNVYKNDKIVDKETDPVWLMMHRPNDDMTSDALRKLLSIYMSTCGEWFIRPVYDERTKRVMIYPLHPEWVTVEGRSTEDGETRRYFDVQYPSGGRETYGEDEILWEREINPCDPYGRARGKGWAAADEVETSEYATKYIKAFFYNDATPGTLVFAAGMGETERERVEANWRNRNQGVENSHGLHLLGNNNPQASISVTQLTPALKDLTIVEIQKASADAVRMLYGVPPELIGQLESSNRATIEEALAILSIMVLVPAATSYRNAFNYKLLPLVSQWIDTKGYSADYVDPTPADHKRFLETFKAAPYHFFRNELRESVGGEPVSNDIAMHVVQGQVIEIDLGDIISERAATPPPLPAKAKLRIAV